MLFTRNTPEQHRCAVEFHRMRSEEKEAKKRRSKVTGAMQSHNVLTSQQRTSKPTLQKTLNLHEKGVYASLAAVHGRSGRQL